MLVIVEGIDRVGKTTLCNMIEKNGFITLKDAFGEVVTNNENQKKLFGFDDTRFPAYSIGKLDTAIQYIKKLSDRGFNIVVDRLHLTELVYGELDRQSLPCFEQISKVDKMIQEMFDRDVMLVFVEPTDILFSSTQANRDLTFHYGAFCDAFEASRISRKIKTDFKHLESAVKDIVANTFKFDFYFASPFFRPDQIEREERMKNHLRSLGYKVFSPKENCNLSPIADIEIQDRVFKDNVTSIANAAAVFAVTDTKDMGTIWEAGYAYAIGKPIVYFAETLGDNQFNLMLAKSGRAAFTSQEHVTKAALDDILYKGVVIDYKGVIE